MVSETFFMLSWKHTFFMQFFSFIGHLFCSYDYYQRQTSSDFRFLRKNIRQSVSMHVQQEAR